MKLLIKLFSAVTLLISSSCYKKDANCEAGIAAIYTYSKELKKTKKLYFEGYGGSFYGGIKQLFANYHSKEQPSLERARILLIETTEFFLSQINKDADLQTHLYAYPFTAENLKIGIGFANWEDLAEDQIAYAFTLQGKVQYCTYSKETKMLVRKHKETYSEALKIVEGRSSGQQATEKDHDKDFTEETL